MLLYRAGRRAEAIVCSGIVVCTVLYNAGYDPSFGGVYGGDTPGPRFLLMALPFLLVPLGLAYRRAPIAVGALIAISAVTMSVGVGDEPPNHIERDRPVVGAAAGRKLRRYRHLE